MVAQQSYICYTVTIMHKYQTDILILGAGIGGYETYRSLNRLLAWHGLNKTITIVDEHNYFTFAPLLHEVASGSVEPSHCTFSLTEMVYKTPHQFIKATVKKVNAEQKTVETSAGTIAYSYCVMALGSGVHFFGTPGADKYAYTVRTLPKAMELRENLIDHLETKPKKINLTVVGGGYSGVEVAGQMAYLRQHTVEKLYPDTKLHIRIVEATATVTPQLPLRAQRKITKRLKKLGVDLLFNAKVAKLEKDEIHLESGKSLPSDFTIWCAGIHNLADCFMHERDCEKNRLPVTKFLNHEHYPEFYGVGDIILGFNDGSDQPFPQLGEAAHKQGEYVASHIIAKLRNKSIEPFHFSSFGTLMPIGERYGVAIMGKFVFSGLLAWWLRRMAYILFMPGFLRKLNLMIDWTLRLFSFSYIIDMDRRK